jgi:hypothetical protein
VLHPSLIALSLSQTCEEECSRHHWWILFGLSPYIISIRGFSRSGGDLSLHRWLGDVWPSLLAWTQDALEFLAKNDSFGRDFSFVEIDFLDVKEMKDGI